MSSLIKIVLFAIFPFSFVQSQDVNKELLKNLQDENVLFLNSINSGDYSIAKENIQNLEYLTNILYGLHLDKELFPDKLLGFHIDKNDKINEIIDNHVDLIRTYKKTDKDSIISIEIIISNHDEIINKIAHVHSFNYDRIDEPGRKYLPESIDSYKALCIVDSRNNFAALAIAVTRNTSIRLNMLGSYNTNILTEIIHELNLVKIANELP